MSTKSGPKAVPVLERVLDKIAIDSNTGCWLFQGTTEHGYGRTTIGQRSNKSLKKVYTHQVVYVHLVGPVPDGMEIDHLCRVRTCCNPDHLEAVTPCENKMRGMSPPATNAKKTHCPRGHEYNEENTLITKAGHRQCLACKRLRYARTYKRKTDQVYKVKAGRPRRTIGMGGAP